MNEEWDQILVEFYLQIISWSLVVEHDYERHCFTSLVTSHQLMNKLDTTHFTSVMGVGKFKYKILKEINILPNHVRNAALSVCFQLTTCFENLDSHLQVNSYLFYKKRR